MNGKEEKQKMNWITSRSETKTLEMNLLNYKEDKETTGKARLGENQDLVFGTLDVRWRVVDVV